MGLDFLSSDDEEVRIFWAENLVDIGDDGKLAMAVQSREEEGMFQVPSVASGGICEREAGSSSHRHPLGTVNGCFLARPLFRYHKKTTEMHVSVN